MKKISPTIVFPLLLFSLLLAPQLPTATAAEPRELVLLNWSEYIDPELVREFERRHGVKIREVYYETDEMRDDLLIDTEGKGYDLVVCNGPSVARYSQRQWLAPLSAAQVPNLRHVEQRWLTMFPEAEGRAVPYFWGTTGIAYRKDKVAGPVTSWKQLYAPAEELRGRIVMIRDSRELIGMALKSLGYSANSVDPGELAAAEKLLLAQKPYVREYSYLTLTEESVLVTGEAWMAMMYSGDALTVKEHESNIEYVVPAEGGNLWVDYLVVLASSSRQELAARFIDFLHEPANNARLAQFVSYATPNRAAVKLLPADFLADPVIYPPAEVLVRCEPYQVLSGRGLRQRNGIFARITR